MKKLMLLVAMLGMVSLASATALTQTAPDGLSPVQEAEFDQTVQEEGTDDASQPAPPPDQGAASSLPPTPDQGAASSPPPAPDQGAAASSPPPAPQCGWYENPERGWGWDYWCYHPTDMYWEPVFYAVP
jgi:hypothetical protein